jgi:flagellar basal body-associated protein FliL
MADDAKPSPAPAKPKKGFPKILVLIVGLTVVEGAGFFVVFKMMGGGPVAAHGEDTHVIEEPVATTRPAGWAEVLVLKSFRVPNDKTGRLFIYDIELSVAVPADKKEHAEELIKEKAGSIGDCVAQIVRSSSDRVLKEDDLRTLRDQLAEGLNHVLGEEGLIERVLIPRFVPLRTD